MKIAGVVLFVCAAYEVLRHICHAERSRFAEAEGIYLLLLRLRSDICERGIPLFEIYRTFENDALEKNGFLSVLRENGFSEALSAHPPDLPSEVFRELALYASGLGERFLEEERSCADRTAAVLADAVHQMHVALPMRLKLKKTVFTTGTGMLLLFLL